MGNHQSSDKDSVFHNLWKTHRAIPVVPLTPNLDVLRVLTKHGNGYHDVGTVISLSKRGQHQDLELSLHQHRIPLLTKSLGQQSYTIADNHGAVATKLTDAAAWFESAASIEVRLPECSVREYNMEHWQEMVHRFNPDLRKVNSMLGKTNWSSERELFIVQKVLLVPHITITATYGTNGAPDVRSPVELPSGLQIKARSLGRGAVEFTISNTKSRKLLPVAFSGFNYTYDTFGERKPEPQARSDGGGASSSHGEGHEDDEEEEDETEDNEEDGAADDEDMGGFFLDEGDWCAQIISEYDPTENVIFPHLRDEEEDRALPRGPPGPPDESPPGSPRSPRDLEDID